MVTYAEKFAPDLTTNTCKEVFNAGSILLVSNLNNCADEPTVYRIHIPSGETPAENDETLALKIASGGTSLTLRKGLILHFPSNKQIVVTAETVINNAVSVDVPVEALPASPPASEAIADTWGLLKVLSPTNIPVNLEDGIIDRTDLSHGGQKADSKTNIKLTSQVTLINDTADKAFWQVIYPASTNSHRIFAFIARGGGRRIWGKALVSANTSDGNIDEIDRPQITLNFQPVWAAPTLRAYLSTTLQTTFDTVMKLAGLAI